MKPYVVIACEILHREISLCAALSHTIVDTIFMPKGLHDMGASAMQKKLQAAIDAIDQEEYQAILFGYGLCNNGILGLTATIPMVFPKAHDCITLLMGSKEAYSTYFNQNPGTFYKSAGWLERDTSGGLTGQSATAYNAADYDEETAAYLAQMLGSWVQNYKQLTFIDTKVGHSAHYQAQTRTQATELGLGFAYLEGDLCLLTALLNGTWDNRYLVVAPGYTPASATHTTEIITCERWSPT